MWKSYPITGFAPDIDPTSDPGALYVGSSNFLPTVRGIVPGPNPTALSGTLVAPCWGGKVLQKNDGTARYFVASNTGLYEYSGGVFTNRSATVYSGTGNRWEFTQFGDVTLAIRSSTQLQQISSGSAFAAVTGAPTANVMVTCGPPASPFVMVFDYTPSGGSRVPNGWKCSALSDYTNWTDSAATFAASGQLVEPTGAFTAAFAFRDGVVAFKQRGMYYGEFLGQPNVPWAWRRISDSVGCKGKNAGCVFNDVLYFADDHGLWMFDGSYPRLIPGAVHRWFRYQQIPSSELVFVRGDEELRVVYFYNVNGDYGVAFNTESGIWTPISQLRSDSTMEVGQFLSGRYVVVSDGTNTSVATLGTGINANQTHKMVTGMHGSDTTQTLLRGVRFKTRAGPTSGVFNGATTLDPQESFSILADQTVAASVTANRMTQRVSDSYVWVDATFSSNEEIVGVSYDLEVNGAR